MFLEEYFVWLTVQEGRYREGSDARIKVHMFHLARVCKTVFQFVFHLHTKQKPVSATYDSVTG
jgi:hypothetical protein